MKKYFIVLAANIAGIMIFCSACSAISGKTEEQYDELTDIYLEAYKTAEERIKDVTYTYEELFGSLVQGVADNIFEVSISVGAPAAYMEDGQLFQ